MHLPGSTQPTPKSRNLPIKSRIEFGPVSHLAAPDIDQGSLQFLVFSQARDICEMILVFIQLWQIRIKCFIANPPCRILNGMAVNGESRHPSLKIVFVLDVTTKILKIPAPFIPLKIKLPICRKNSNFLAFDSHVISARHICISCQSRKQPCVDIQLHKPGRMINHPELHILHHSPTYAIPVRISIAGLLLVPAAITPSGLPYF